MKNKEMYSFCKDTMDGCLLKHFGAVALVAGRLLPKSRKQYPHQQFPASARLVQKERRCGPKESAHAALLPDRLERLGRATGL